MSAREIIDIYISFFEKRGHKRIANSPLVPENDPTTLFTSAGMQPLIPYLLGQTHPEGKRLVNVQNCFRAQDIDEIGDNRHTTFFRMLGNWSLGDYFKSEQLPWFFEFLTKGLNLDPERLYISIFEGDKDIPRDESSAVIWKEIFENAGLSPDGRIFYCGVTDNWWSRSGIPANMPVGEIGGPDCEVYFDLQPDQEEFTNFQTVVNSGRLLEIGNSVFIEYQKTGEGFQKLPQSNVDFGAGLERLLASAEGKADMFQTSLLSPIVSAIEKATNKQYKDEQKSMRVIVDHLTASVFIIASGILPSNKEQGYILRRLIRRAFDNINLIRGFENMTVPTKPILESIIQTYSNTDPYLTENAEGIISGILQEVNNYRRTLDEAKKFITRKYQLGDELRGAYKISAQDAFLVYTSYGLSPTQIKSLGFIFDDQAFANKMKEHQNISRAGATKKFAGGLADHSEQTIRGHTATHLLHKAIRDLLGDQVHQSGSNITADRVRFDFNYDRTLTEDEIKQLEQTVNEKIEENLPVFFEFMTLVKAKEIGAIGLFDEKYSDKVKIYLIGNKDPQLAYSKEFCGGPHVNFTSEVKSFKIIKQENIGHGLRRLYALVG